jgi:hypothetical protein
MKLAGQLHHLLKVANDSRLGVRLPYQKYLEERGWSHRSPLVAQVHWLTAQLQYSPQNQLPVYSVHCSAFEPAKTRQVERRMKLAAQLHH